MLQVHLLVVLYLGCQGEVAVDDNAEPSSIGYDVGRDLDALGPFLLVDDVEVAPLGDIP